MTYIYRLIPYDFKTEFTKDELTLLKTNMVSLNLPNKELYLLLVEFKKILLNLEGYLQDIGDDTTIFTYCESIDIVNDQPLYVMLGGFKDEHYVALIRFTQQEINQLLDKQEDNEEQTVWQHDDNEQLIYVDIPVKETPWYSKDISEMVYFNIDEETDFDKTHHVNSNQICDSLDLTGFDQVQRLLEEVKREWSIGQTLLEQIRFNNQLISKLISLINEREDLTNENDQLLNMLISLQSKIVQYAKLLQQ